MLVYLNGEYLPREEAKVSVEDRGFVFGDGVYEVTRALQGRLYGEAGHWARLERGMRELRIDPGERVSRQIVREASERLCGEVSATLGLPCTDPFAMGVEPIIDWMIECFEPAPMPVDAARV